MASSGGSDAAPAAEPGKYTSLKALLAAPKGLTKYKSGDAVMLHVMWVAPTAAAAATLLTGLRACAAATHRDTPATATYFFRLSHNNADLVPPPPATVGEHPQLASARKKVAAGVPLPAVRAALARQGLDPALLEVPADTPLPEAMRAAAASAVAVEFTEVYLDERAFMEHAGSRDYLDGYGVVMTPGLALSAPLTLRMGTPPQQLVDKVLEPVLQACDPGLPLHCSVWYGPPAPSDEGAASFHASAVFLSLEYDGCSPEAVAAAVPARFRDACTSLVAFPHPQRHGHGHGHGSSDSSGTVRLMAVMPRLPPAELLAALASSPHSMPVPVARGEVHMTPLPAGTAPAVGEAAAATLRAALDAAGLPQVHVCVSVDVAEGGGDSGALQAVGYVLHSRAAELTPVTHHTE